MASQHSHAPWRKSLLIPFWVIQLLLEIILIAGLAVAESALVVYHDNYEDTYYDNNDFTLDNNAVRQAQHMYAPPNGYHFVC